MKKNLFILIAICFAAAAFAQTNLEDVVYLKNGSIIRGIITEQKIGENLKIQLLGGSVFVFQQNEIDSIKKEAVIAAATPQGKKDYFRKTKGYRNITELGIICGFGSNSNTQQYYYGTNPAQSDFGVSLHTINGYQFSRWLFVGGGVGIDRFITYKQTFSPFYLRVASELLKKRVTPYIYADIGYAHMWKFKSDEYTTYNNQGGIYHGAGGGVRIYTRGHASVIMGVGYRRNTSETTWQYAYEGSPVYNIQRAYQRVVFSMGVTF